MAVLFPTKLEITSIASDMPMKKHTSLKQDIEIQNVLTSFETRNDVSTNV